VADLRKNSSFEEEGGRVNELRMSELGGVAQRRASLPPSGLQGEG
jgi:hypothetical protein